MGFTEVIKEEARLDIKYVMDYYASKSINLDKRFFAEFEHTVKRILLNPLAFKKIYKTFRQTAIKKFPYVVMYEPVENKVIIYAVFNTWQNPKRKINRLSK
jgi:plasmid stabilization system protein ParE